MEISPAKLAANAANAQRSSGPRTEAGKAISARNALQHGLSAKQLVVTEDQQQDFEDMQTRLHAEIDPQGPLEEETFKQLLSANWNLHRFRILEAGLMANNLDPLLDDSVTKTLDRLYRYAGHHQRAYHKAMAELRTLQTNRKLKDTVVEEEAKEIPALASVSILLRQARANDRHQAMAVDWEMEQLARDAMRCAGAHGPVQNEPKVPVPNTPKEGANAA